MYKLMILIDVSNADPFISYIHFIPMSLRCVSFLAFSDVTEIQLIYSVTYFEVFDLYLSDYEKTTYLYNCINAR